MVIIKQIRIYDMHFESRKTTDYYGKIFLSNSCGFYQITLANNTVNMEATFLKTNTKVRVNATQVDKGSVADPYYPSLCDIGYLGECSGTVDEEGGQLKEYVAWYGMIRRCYGNENLEAYKYIIVSEEFLNFAYFQEWYHKQIGAGVDGFDMDKDILSTDVKIYAEDTCVFVPSEINMFFAKTGSKRGEYPIGVSWHKGTKQFKSNYSNGNVDKVATCHDNEWEAFLAYKRAKESRGKALAEKWRGKIDNRVYEKLVNFKVLITD